MGATMTGIIEWTNDAQIATWPQLHLPAGPARWADDYIVGMLFVTDKEYDFFAAIAGVRSRFSKPALVPLRGSPMNRSRAANDYFGTHDDHLAGWLHLSEIDRCIADVPDGTFSTGFELDVALGLMRTLVPKLGDSHVRLVFNIED